MMAEFEGIHPDEGTIHAWLDDALDASESARVESHVATCAECGERVAEARGLIAGASRVVGMLDDRPRPLIQPATSPTNDMDLSAWRWLRVTPARAAIAAVLLVAVGITLTRDRIAVESTAGFKADSAPIALSTPAGDASAPAASPRAPAAPGSGTVPDPVPDPKPDPVLGAAIAKRIAQDQPPRTVAAAPGVAVPSAAPAPPANVPTMNAEPAREVASGRASARLSEVVTTAATADKSMAKVAVAEVQGVGCYRVTFADAAPVSWGGIALPAEISLASAATHVDAEGMTRREVADVRTGAAIGSWARLGGDSLSLSLRGASATTTGILGPNRSDLKGTLAVSSVAAQAAPSMAAGAAADSRVARARFDAGANRAANVVAKRIACP